MKKLIFIVTLITMIPAWAVSQDSLVQNLFFTPSYKKSASFGDEDYNPRNARSFYLYRNCVYKIHPSYGGLRIVRITDIRNDSIYYESYKKYSNTGYRKDTISRIHPSEISAISRSETESKQLLTTLYLEKFRFTFTMDRQPKVFPSQTITLRSADSVQSSAVTIIPYFTDHGIDRLYEKCGEVFYYDSTSTLDCNTGRYLVPPPPVHNKRRDVIWFTPSFASYISGVAVGLQTLGLNEGAITISGVNINADLLTGFATIYVIAGYPKGKKKLEDMPDTIPWNEMKDRINGLSLSGGGLIGGADLRGVGVNGLICFLTRTRGINITGLRNEVNRFEGVLIAGFVNRSTQGRGLQIALVNKCKDLRGVQLGLWNENSKRKLPLINWNFN